MRSDEDLIRAALAVAGTAGPRDVPVGAVVVGADGTELVVLRGGDWQLGA